MPARNGSGANTNSRGLGWVHQKRRARLLPQAWGKPCPKCGKPMLQGQQLDLDHDLPRVLGGKAGEGQMAHAYCNRSAGARLGAALRRARALPPATVHSRRW